MRAIITTIARVSIAQGPRILFSSRSIQPLITSAKRSTAFAPSASIALRNGARSFHEFPTPYRPYCEHSATLPGGQSEVVYKEIVKAIEQELTNQLVSQRPIDRSASGQRSQDTDLSEQTASPVKIHMYYFGNVQHVNEIEEVICERSGCFIVFDWPRWAAKPDLGPIEIRQSDGTVKMRDLRF